MSLRNQALCWGYCVGEGISIEYEVITEIVNEGLRSRQLCRRDMVMVVSEVLTVMV
jgi:hypothetical protein